MSKEGCLLCAPSIIWDSKDLSKFVMLCDIACEPFELEMLLFPRAESTYNTVAREFLGDQFLYGSIVHEIQGLNDGTVKDSD
ncbi:hypothetical protein PsorP6_010884 [Peronosclerospora sorghi]|uniref:Uncharacterized protein n=1 Tax=Peronosclerospora sorghi TaxID=230839 RepID=A0ACC0VWT8_9STRA|nr:hypothetical protein PsorP6_010884 [Peronosclerospora sorghi]